ncbi:cyclase, partial [Micromonospora sp. GCM10011542]
PDRLIHWRSKGEKGSVDGTVSFHEITPDLTRILVVLEYHPQGLFEHTGNLWRAQGRRARLELKHFVRHVMTQTALDPDSVEGWRGEIRDSQVVKDHETALREEQEARTRQEQRGRGREAEEEREERPEEEQPLPRRREPEWARHRDREPQEPREPREEREDRPRPRPARRPEPPRRPVVRRRHEERKE